MMSSLRALWFFALFFVVLVMILSEQSVHASPPAGTNWGLTFADEFNGTTLDSMKWINHYPWNNTGSPTKAANVTLTNGVLNLIQNREVDGSFTGSCVSSRLTDSPEVDKFNFTYGYVEASIKFPTLPGSGRLSGCSKAVGRQRWILWSIP